MTELELWLPTAIALTGEVVPLMTRDEARACVDEIKTHAETIRERLYAFSRGEGWRPLEYPSFKDCLTAEFGMSEVHAYRLIEAYEIDRILAEPTADTLTNPGVSRADDVAVIETPIPERHARELVPIKDDHAAVREVMAEVVAEAKQEGRKPRAKDIKEAVKRRRTTKRPEMTLVHVPGQVLQRPRPPREQPALLDRLYKTVQAFPDKAVTTALAEEIQAANLDLPEDAIRKLTDHLKQVNSGRLALVRGLECLSTVQRNGTA